MQTLDDSMQIDTGEVEENGATRYWMSVECDTFGTSAIGWGDTPVEAMADVLTALVQERARRIALSN